MRSSTRSLSGCLPNESRITPPAALRLRLGVRERTAFVMLRHIFRPADAGRLFKRTVKACLKLAANKAPNHFRKFAVAASDIAGLSHENKRSRLADRRILAFGELRNPICHGGVAELLFDAGAISVRQYYLWANKIFSERNFDELSSILEVDVPEFHPVQAYLRARVNDYRGLSAISVGEILPVIENDGRYAFLLRPVLNLYLQQLCRSRRIEEAAKVASSHDLTSFTPQTIMGLVNALLVANQRTMAASFLVRFTSKADPVKQLYFHEVATTLGDQRLTKIPINATWRQLLEVYAANYRPVDDDDAKDVKRHLVGPLLRIPDDDNDLMDIRSSQEKRDALTQLIITSIRNQTPLSLVRLGDGESYCFDTDTFSPELRKRCTEDNLVREVHWWGEHVPDNLRTAIRSESRRAIENANILGIPGVHRLIRDRGGFKRRLLDNRQKRGLAVVLPTILDHQNRRRIFTEERVHQVMFNAEYLSALSQNAHRTIVVSCWDRDVLSGIELRNPEFIVIPGATKVRDAGARPLFETYTETINRIRAHSAPGVLCLVGGGIIGKIFIDAAKQEGAVALDVGSVMDYFAGRATRNVADMVI